MGADIDNKHLSNIIKYDAMVTRKKKKRESNKHKSIILWFTGLQVYRLTWPVFKSWF
jgi:hypothetical protein